MAYEMIITDARDLSEEKVGFGGDKAMAERVFNWTWQGLLHEGYVGWMNAKNPNFIEFLHRKGSTALFIELRYRPDFDMANILQAISLTAEGETNPGFGCKYELYLSERLWNNAQYTAIVVGPDGRQVRHALAGSRAEALRAFISMVREHGCTMEAVERCPDADHKWMVLDESGLTTLEFVEVQA